MTSLDSFFESIQLPAMSEVAHALIKTLSEEEVSVREVRNIIARDPALSARLLRLANSAHFGLPRGVGTLDDAIAMVGLAQVRTLSLGACMNAAFPAVPGLNRNAYWKNSMACAGYCQWLADGLDMDRQQAWLTGMMLRLGELLIGQTEPLLLMEIEKMPQLPGNRWEREKRLIGFTEGQITAELARRWNFPMQIVQALQRSADPLTEQAFSRLGAIVHLAALLADTPETGAEALATLPPAVVACLHLDPQWLARLAPAPASFIDLSAH